ncbi:MAG: hypothetical protein BGO78_00620 [Chloroflexi bacterium 44-23]|nr:MAG: hypothetical protein BGO78_00620 [Chloroflexi bacterium 44-23]
MCDTFVVLPEFTQDGSIIFGKNSDRDANEPHYVEIIQEREYPSGSNVECTYVSIPQVERTNRVLLSRPVWIWGAEMGVNQWGLVIGNEAIFSKIKANKEPGLIGMDYLRLALERAKNAQEAIKTITSLLETYGQGGNCGFSHPFYYHNSFLIADHKEAWKLETVDRVWAAKRIEQHGSISNCLTIGTNWDLASDNLVSYAVEHKLYNKRNQFNFANVFSDWLYTRFSNARGRKNCTSQQVQALAGKFQVEDAFRILRSHHGDADKFSPGKASLSSDVCMHAGYGPIRVSQTTGSMVTKTLSGNEDIWATATSAPCLSLFKPLRLSQEKIFDYVPDTKFDNCSYWWKHEVFHRRMLRAYQTYFSEFSMARDAIEKDFLLGLKETKQSQDFEGYWVEIMNRSNSFLEEWLEKTKNSEGNSNSRLYQKAWKKNNQDANISL